MSNVFSGLVEPGADGVEHVAHGISAIEHGPSLLVTQHIVLYFSLQFLVDLLVLDDVDHEGVDLGVEQVVLG
jgi:hypothetical protein